jgi:hypothetical protein
MTQQKASGMAKAELGGKRLGLSISSIEDTRNMN